MNGIIIQYWTINPGGIPQVSNEPIIAVDRFNVLSMKECSSANWNLKDTNIWGESAHYTKGMQWNVITLSSYDFQLQTVKHLIHNNSGLFQWGLLYPGVLGCLK